MKLWGVFPCLLASASFSRARLVARAQPAVSRPTVAPSPVQTVDSASTTTFAEPRRIQLQKRAEVKEINGYTHLGCWQDGSGIIMSVSHLFDSGMSPELCRSFCSVAKCNMFGIEQGCDCYCGNSIQPWAFSATDNSCTKTCWGAKDAMCGGVMRMIVYSATADFPAGTQFGVYSPSSSGGLTSIFLLRILVSFFFSFFFFFSLSLSP